MAQHNNLDLDVVEKGNTNLKDGRVGIISHHAAKKIRSEIINEKKTDPCEMTDMFNKSVDKSLTDGKQFVRKVHINHNYRKLTKTGKRFTKEFAVILLHEDIKRILEHCPGPVIIFHIDATGSLVKDPSCHGKKGHNESRLLNYNIVLRANNITYPIVEMVSSMGNSETIAYMMRQLRTLLLTDVPNFKPKKIVLISDWAPQNLNAAVAVFNFSTLIQYINLLWRDNEPSTQLPIFPYICVSHFIHAVAKYCNKNLDPNKLHTTKAIIIQVFTTIIMAKSYEEAFQIISNAIFIFFSENETNELNERKGNFMRLINSKDACEETRKINEEANRYRYDNQSRDLEDNIFDMEKFKEKRFESEFYKRFQVVAEEAIEKAQKTNLGSKTQANKFFDPQGKNGVLFKLLELKIAFLPLWSVIHYRKYNSGRPSNGIIENHHNEIKNNELMNIFPRPLCNYVDERLKNLSNKIETSARPRILELIQHGKQRKKKYVENMDEEDLTNIHLEETYGKKRKYTPPAATTKKTSHFDAKALTKAFTQNQQTPTPRDKCTPPSETTKNISHFDTEDLTNAYTQNQQSPINQSDESNSEIMIIDEMIGDGVFEIMKENYSAEQQQQIIEQAKARPMSTYKSGVLRCLDYYNGFLVFVRTGKMTLKYSEFISLKFEKDRKHDPQNGWLDLELIEFYLRLMMPLLTSGITTKIKLMSLRTNQILFGDGEISEQWKHIKQKTKDAYTSNKDGILIMPILLSGHFLLVVVNNTNNTMYYLDSMHPGGSKRNAESLRRKFIKRTSSTVNYEIVYPKVQQQQDFCSCGVFTIRNSLSMIKWLANPTVALEIPHITDVLEERESIMDDILNLSDDVTKTCPKCYKDAIENDVKTCQYCQRNMHRSCIEKSPGTVSNNDLIICFECAKFLLTDSI